MTITDETGGGRPPGVTGGHYLDIIYIRVSTEEQEYENQLADCQRIAPAGAVVRGEHGSAWKADGLRNRPIFAEIVEGVKARRVRSVTVWDLDRVYRKRAALVGFLRLCKAQGVVLRSYRQQWLNQIGEMPEPWNEIMFDLMIQVMGWLAEEESQKKSDRIRAAYARNQEGWGRPRARFNEPRAYHLLFVAGRPIRAVAAELGVSVGTVARSKRVWAENPPSFIKEESVQERDDS